MKFWPGVIPQCPTTDGLISARLNGSGSNELLYK